MAARHEWVKHNEHMTNEEYQQYFDFFNPDQFDPAAWAKQAKAAGMKYADYLKRQECALVGRKF